MQPYAFAAELWEYPGAAAWCFVTLPKAIADEIKIISDTGMRRGFGSVKVRAKMGTSEWATSIFPDKATGSYLLPIKKQVRVTEAVRPGDMLGMEIVLL